jgi:hypothetical protein
MRTIFINDPVAGVSYTMNSKAKIAHKMSTVKDAAMMDKIKSELSAARAKMPLGVEERVVAGVMASGVGTHTVESGKTAMYISEGMPARRITLKPQVKEEQLGTQTIEGLACDGTRTTMTIPAGQIGNERPIEVVTERWYSPQLHTTVMTRTNDPRMGETVYKLLNIKLDEPAESLFAVPSDYTVQ